VSIQRWRESEVMVEDNEHGWWVWLGDHEKWAKHAYDDGYAAALLDAVVAVYRTCGDTKCEGISPCAHDDAVAAIDALRTAQFADAVLDNLPGANA
jgi:hypothetical protein